MAPAIAGAFVLTTRGGDFELHIGQDVSIGYLSHTNSAVTLYLQESFTFLFLTAEAAVAMSAPGKAKKASGQNLSFLHACCAAPVAAGSVCYEPLV